jgi:hypothetical protein
MIYMRFTGINYYKLAVEKDRDSIFTAITTVWKSGLSLVHTARNSSAIYCIIFRQTKHFTHQ